MPDQKQEIYDAFMKFAKLHGFQESKMSLVDFIDDYSRRLKEEIKRRDAKKPAPNIQKKRRSVCIARQISSSSEDEDEDEKRSEEDGEEESEVEDEEDDENYSREDKECTEIEKESDFAEEQEENNTTEEAFSPKEDESLHSSDDDDEDFDDFIRNVKTPKKNAATVLLSSSSEEDDDGLKDFIVDDVDDDDDEPIETKNVNESKWRQTYEVGSSSESSEIEFTLQSSRKTKKVKTRNTFKTPTSSRLLKTPKSSINTPSVLDSVTTPKTPSSSRAAYSREYKRLRDTTAKEIFQLFNRTVFDNQLPQDLPIVFNKRMTKTAGFCNYYLNSYTKVKSAKIELAEKVCDSVERLRDTIIHELCHAAAWIINGVKCGHGPVWKHWANKAHKAHEDLPPISRCHQFDIGCKYNFQCLNPRCKQRFGRHSKSLKHCPNCQGPLQVFGSDGFTPLKERKANKFALFVKAEYAKTRAENPDIPQGDLMKLLGQKFSSLST